MCSSFSSFVCTVLIVKHRWLSRTVFIVGLLVALPSLVTAQEATIVGTVTDPSGAVVPKVAILVTNVETGAVRTLATNDAWPIRRPQLAYRQIRRKGPSFRF